MIRIAICEDNEKDKEYIVNLLENYFKNIKKECSIDTFISGNDFVYSDKDFDIVFMDVEMPELDGFETSKFINERCPSTLIIIVSSYEKYMLDAFKIQPFRFIPKKMLEDRLFEAVDASLDELSRRPVTTILLNNKRSIRKISLCNIIYLYREGKYIIFKMNDGEVIRDRNSISNVINSLDMNIFAVISRGTVCNLKCVTNLDAQYVYMTNGEKLLISREKVAETRKKLLNCYATTRKNK